MTSNADAVIAIELLAAAQGIDFHAPLTSSKSLEAVRQKVRAQTPTLEEDRYMHADMAVTIEQLRSGSYIADPSSEKPPPHY